MDSDHRNPPARPREHPKKDQCLRGFNTDPASGKQPTISMGRIITPGNTQQVRHIHLLRGKVLPHQARQRGETTLHTIRTQHTTQHARTPRVDSVHETTVHPQHARGYRSHNTHQLRGDPLQARETHASGNTNKSGTLGNRECPAFKERLRPNKRRLRYHRQENRLLCMVYRIPYQTMGRRSLPYCSPRRTVLESRHHRSPSRQQPLRAHQEKATGRHAQENHHPQQSW